jgi:hypothetical protein
MTWSLWLSAAAVGDRCARRKSVPTGSFYPFCRVERIRSDALPAKALCTSRSKRAQCDCAKNRQSTLARSSDENLSRMQNRLLTRGNARSLTQRRALNSVALGSGRQASGRLWRPCRAAILPAANPRNPVLCNKVLQNVARSAGAVCADLDHSLFRSQLRWSTRLALCVRNAAHYRKCGESRGVWP